ncbi:MAG: PKD domain-containing protein [candidate division KSB1 bacterium]|nr:PKD domain-containing protein [candidate division KSB1 bacterium]MDZ7273245.1 PKD domain-containing protein [candidate division KSB1 bacterium]MDZ7285347.1 PKD domain-containing protein [candidate division KSB1 bacterium]MDZ7298379.1 PKD domain-containing protein [candidate division KSB1 bacterium]MDZ7306457.1 PKD domain-containing protein [candidate division KSB1 bacterium]
MRLKLVATALLSGWLCVNTGFAQTWGTEIDLGTGSTPDMDVDPVTGKIYVVYHDNGVVLVELNASGAIIKKENVSVAAADKEGGFRFGATVAIDPTTGLPHLCYREPLGSDMYSIHYTRKRSEGSWTSPLEIASNLRRAYSVRMEVDSKGVVHVVHGYATQDVFGEANYLRIVNGAEDKFIPALNPYRVDDRVEIAVGGDDVVNIVLNRPDDLDSGGPVTYYRSTDGGNSLVKIGDIHHAGAQGRNGNADVYADQAGNVHFVYGSARDQAHAGTQSVRYARFRNGSKVRDVVVTKQGELHDWHQNLGVGSVAASNDGKNVVVVYNLGDGDALFARLSQNEGQTWGAPVQLASQSGGSESRDKHVVRAAGKTFYLAYPSFGKVYLRLLKTGGNPPVANAGGPYNGSEGSPISFNASASTDDGQIVRYRWDWTSDGVFDDSTNTPQIQHTYPDDFNGKATLEVVDNENDRSRVQVQVTVANVAPVADAGGPYSGVLNQPVTLTASVTDPGTKDTHTFKWDLNNDGTFEADGKTVTATYNSPGKKRVRVRVTDNNGASGSDTASVTIGSGAPVASKIPNQTVAEGTPFAPITLDNYVSDSDNTPDQMVWSTFGQVHLIVTIVNRIATVAPADSEWAGSETISFVVRDPSNKRDTTTAKFTITAVNDNPRVSTIPSQRVKEGRPFASITLDDYVFDPDHRDNQITWSTSPNALFKVTIANRVATVAPADSEWTGNSQITFIARDPANGSDSTRVRFTIDPVNDPPRLSTIPDQVIKRGETFTPINFADYVRDPDDPSDKLKLSGTGNRELALFISGLIATVLPPNASWIGSETITFTVKDTSNATATTRVTFTVRDSNTPPRWLNTVNYSFNEDDTLRIPYADLRARVKDDEDPPEQWKFSLVGNDKIKFRNTATTFNLFAERDWHGVETVQMVVNDGKGARDSVTTQITVVSVPDPLRSFRVLSPIGEFYSARPASITFDWEDTFDPENPGSPINYLWLLSKNVDFSNIIKQVQVVNKSEYVLTIDASMPGGFYYWKVIASGSSGTFVESSNIGSFTIPALSVTEAGGKVPESFALHPNYPNPFNPQTNLVFDLAKPGHVVLTIYGIDGKKVATLTDREYQAGQYTLTWDAHGLASGTYLVELRVTNAGGLLFEARQKMSLLR